MILTMRWYRTGAYEAVAADPLQGGLRFETGKSRLIETRKAERGSRATAASSGGNLHRSEAFVLVRLSRPYSQGNKGS